MNQKQFELMRDGKGFIAALDQSGGSSPKALADYGIPEDQYDSEEKMFDLIHEMRARIISSSSFKSDKILGAILFKQTMERDVEGIKTADYLWDKKGIIPFLKVDQGKEKLEDDVMLMKPMTELDDLLERAKKYNIFGTKMRSVIKRANPVGIKKIAEQQFEYGKKIIDAGFVPILEPEVDIHSKDKEKSEEILKKEILKYLDQLSDDEFIMLKLSIPDKKDFYRDLIEHPNVLRVVALSGGYSQKEAVEKLAENHGLIASFSRALLQKLHVDQTEEEFNAELEDAVEKIYQASIT
ncbi:MULTISPECIES: fructose bisphosphate aldolase [unclassified Halanaerobium]|uniref:fructose bisphosphate aldolase n=1 Tax=unclassified Halanaerobium TaxID=2641197 RepID=UPI000DF33B08|nr:MULTISPECIES: fructose bisphosphate aldolase [unclassified Halanaerobium]RCW41859.1 fructose-bisphosphate aldolase class I [Halanaerobium sp. MA284_MarDTE_T2]RCW84238.1 fructose-bisphosphate aldolase class I [Halanaerobium sp. DL-01]